MSKKNTVSNIDKLLNFSEELSWLLNSYKNLKIEDAVSEIKQRFEMDNLNNISKGQSNFGYSKFENKKQIRNLVGLFPELFQDKVLFPSNFSIIEFANEVLHMKINPSKNRSKTEIIGEIVCTTYSLSDIELEKVVNALNKMLDNENVIKNVKEMKNDESFSWNVVIQKLSEI